MPEDDSLVEFEEFQKLVGMPTHNVRIALRVIGKDPISLPQDRRQKRYKREWVAEVQQWITENLAGQK